MRSKAFERIAFILGKPKIVLGDWSNTMLGTFYRLKQIVRGSWSRNRSVRRELRLDGSSISSKGPKENENGGCSIMQWRLSRLERATPRRAEGFERHHSAEKLQAYNVARGSCGEVRSLLYVVEDNYPNASSAAREARKLLGDVGSLTSGLIASTRKRLITKAGTVVALLGLLAWTGAQILL